MLDAIVALLLLGVGPPEVARRLGVSLEWVDKVMATDGFKAMLALANGEVPKDQHVGLA